MRKELLGVFSGFPDQDDAWRYEQTLRISEKCGVFAMEDESAFFIKAGRIDFVGKIYLVEQRNLKLLDQEGIKKLEKDDFWRAVDGERNE